MVHTSEKTFGSLDVLVNNAGIQYVAPIENFRSKNGTRSLRSTSPRPSTLSAPQCPE